MQVRVPPHVRQQLVRDHLVGLERREPVVAQIGLLVAANEVEAVVELEKGCATVTGRALSEATLLLAVEAAGMTGAMMGSPATAKASPAKLTVEGNEVYRKDNEQDNELGNEQRQPMQHIHLKVDGMSCEHWCALGTDESGTRLFR